MGMSGSLCLRLLPSGFLVLPERLHIRSLESFPSLFHLNSTFGVISEAVGSLWVLSSVEADGCLNVC